MSEYKRLEEAISNIKSQRIGIDYSRGKDMAAIHLIGEQAEAVIKVLSEYKDIAKAKAEGRLAVFPCKPGQRVWFTRNNQLETGYVRHFESEGTKPYWVAMVQDPPRGPTFVSVDLLCLSKEEAEAALKIGGEEA